MKHGRDFEVTAGLLAVALAIGGAADVDHPVSRVVARLLDAAEVADLFDESVAVHVDGAQKSIVRVAHV